MPVRQTLAETGRIYRKVNYGPLLDIFLLDMRSYRGPNDHRRDTTFGPESRILGAVQTQWFKRELMASQATWKIVAADLPIGLISEDAIAQGDGAPRISRPRLVPKPFEAGEIDICWFGRQHVARRARDEHIGPESLAQPRDVHLDGLHGRLRRLLTPERIDQLRARHDPVRVQHEQRQQRARLLPTQRKFLPVLADFERTKHGELHRAI